MKSLSRDKRRVFTRHNKTTTSLIKNNFHNDKNYITIKHSQWLILPPLKRGLLSSRSTRSLSKTTGSRRSRRSSKKQASHSRRKREREIGLLGRRAVLLIPQCGRLCWTKRASLLGTIKTKSEGPAGG